MFCRHCCVLGDVMWKFNMREFLNFFCNFRWLISLCKLQGIQIVNILDQLLFLARTDTGGAQVISGASFGNCWYSSSDTNYASKKSFGLSSLYIKMSVAATVGMTLKDKFLGLVYQQALLLWPLWGMHLEKQSFQSGNGQPKSAASKSIRTEESFLHSFLNIKDILKIS